MKKSQGFTLIELLTYVGIFAVVAGLLTGILAITLKVQNRESAANEVTDQLNFVMQTIQRLVRESSLIEMDAGTATSTLTLRMKDLTKGITTVYLENNAILMKEKNETTQIESISNLTSDKVIVDQLSFKKFSQPPGHDTVSVDMQMTYNSQSQQSQFSKTLHSAIARVSAATFDSDLLPGADNSYSIGINPATRWKDISISNLLNIGQLATDPSSAQNGSMYYNTSNNVFRGYKNGAWSNLGESFWTASGNDIYNANSGNVGVGASSPNYKLDVSGTFRATATSTFSGNVGIGTTNPSSALQVNGLITANNANTMPIYSVQPASRATPGAAGVWKYTGESLTITVPSGPSRVYRIVLRQMVMNGVATAGIWSLSSSNTSCCDFNLLPYFYTPGSGYWITTNAERHVTLAPGTYNYYVWLYLTAVSGGQIANAQSDNRNYCDLFAEPK